MNSNINHTPTTKLNVFPTQFFYKNLYKHVIHTIALEFHWKNFVLSYKVSIVDCFVGINLDCWSITMGSSQRRTRRNERNQNKIEEKREKDKERKRRRRTILREEEIPNEAMMEEANPIDIGIISKLCNLIFIFIVYNLIDFIVYNLIVDKFHSLQFHKFHIHVNFNSIVLDNSQFYNLQFSWIYNLQFSWIYKKIKSINRNTNLAMIFVFSLEMCDICLYIHNIDEKKSSNSIS